MADLLRFDANTVGRDYVVGDIHGCFTLLARTLHELGFDPAADRLFAVGDLIDRGPESDAAGDWLTRPWFHSLRGNHEELALLSEHDRGAYLTWMTNGGEWWRALSEGRRAGLRMLFARLPLAFEIDCGEERVGVVHAEVPLGTTWDALCAALERPPSQALRIRESLTWGRRRYYAGDNAGVAGVARLYCGHTVVDTPQMRGNIAYLDTGAFCTGRLTVVPACPPPI